MPNFQLVLEVEQKQRQRLYVSLCALAFYTHQFFFLAPCSFPSCYSQPSPIILLFGAAANVPFFSDRGLVLKGAMLVPRDAYVDSWLPSIDHVDWGTLGLLSVRESSDEI